MEKEIIWTATARKNFWDVVYYLQQTWPENVLDHFHQLLELKIALLKRQPNIGFKSAKYSRFRRTLITKHYILIYSIKKDHIVILRLKHSKQNK